MSEEEIKNTTTTSEPVEPQQEEDFKDKYLRTLAEGENLRKRLAKEKQEMLRFGIENTIGDFLPAIDQFESALRMANNASAEVKNWAFGFQMILSQFRDVLHQHGVSSFVSKGEYFDPNLHEAIEMIETDEVPEGTILEECTQGYKNGQRALKVARVKVAKAKNINSKGENHE